MDTSATPTTPASNMSGFARRATAVQTPPQEPETPVVAAPSIFDDGFEAGTTDTEVPKEAAATDKGPLTYADRIKEFKLTIPQALKIIDDMAVGGAYIETAKLSASINIVLSTRSARFNSFLTKEMDTSTVQKVGRMNQILSEWQLAASLEQYGERAMAPLSDEMPEDVWRKSLESRRTFIMRLPSPIFLAMCNKLVKFDAKILTVISDGYEENF